jgi:hypothetical protein
MKLNGNRGNRRGCNDKKFVIVERGCCAKDRHWRRQFAATAPTPGSANPLVLITRNLALLASRTRGFLHRHRLSGTLATAARTAFSQTATLLPQIASRDPRECHRGNQHGRHKELAARSYHCRRQKDRGDAGLLNYRSAEALLSNI